MRHYVGSFGYISRSGTRSWCRSKSRTSGGSPSESLSCSKTSILTKSLSKGRKEALLAEAEPEEPEMTEEESEAYFKERNKYYTKLAQDPNLTKEQAQEIADFYSLTLEEVWDENREHKTKSNIKDTASTVVKEEVERSICRRVIRFIRRLFRG